MLTPRSLNQSNVAAAVPATVEGVADNDEHAEGGGWVCPVDDDDQHDDDDNDDDEEGRPTVLLVGRKADIGTSERCGLVVTLGVIGCVLPPSRVVMSPS